MIRKNDRNKNSVTNKSENNKYYEFVFQKDVKVTQILDLFEKVSAN